MPGELTRDAQQFLLEEPCLARGDGERRRLADFLEGACMLAQSLELGEEHAQLACSRGHLRPANRLDRQEEGQSVREGRGRRESLRQEQRLLNRLALCELLHRAPFVKEAR